MTDFQALMVDELRAEFRRAQPPPAMLAAAQFEPCICHVIRPDRREGYRIIWKRKTVDAPYHSPIFWRGYTITLLLPL